MTFDLFCLDSHPLHQPPSGDQIINPCLPLKLFCPSFFFQTGFYQHAFTEDVIFMRFKPQNAVFIFLRRCHRQFFCAKLSSFSFQCVFPEFYQLVPTNSARSLGVMTDDQLTFKVHVASIVWSCRYALYNIRRIRPDQPQQASQLLVISHLRLNLCR